MNPETTFSADWLTLRNDADTRARSVVTVRLARHWLEAHLRNSQPSGHLHLTDLGTGSGANPAFLAPCFPGPQHWRLVDHDTTLLEHAAKRVSTLRDLGGRPVSFDVHHCDLDTALEDLAETQLVCASALIDLVSERWLKQLVNICHTKRIAILISLSVDGYWRFNHLGQDDNDPQDAQVRLSFNAHQQRDKGVGGALGPDAGTRLAALLKAAGFTVTVAPSPWCLQLDDDGPRALAHALLNGWRQAAIEQSPEAESVIHAWHARRCATLNTPGMMLTVGHVDLFASPSHPNTQ